MRPTIEAYLQLSGVNTFPYEGKGDRFAVDEVRDSHKRPIMEASLRLSGA